MTIDLRELNQARVTSLGRLETGDELAIEVELDRQTHVVGHVEEVVQHDDTNLFAVLHDLWLAGEDGMVPVTDRGQLDQIGSPLLLRDVRVDRRLSSSRDAIAAVYNGRSVAVDPTRAYHTNRLHFTA